MRRIGEFCMIPSLTSLCERMISLFVGKSAPNSWYPVRYTIIMINNDSIAKLIVIIININDYLIGAHKRYFKITSSRM